MLAKVFALASEEAEAAFLKCFGTRFLRVFSSRISPNHRADSECEVHVW